MLLFLPLFFFILPVFFSLSQRYTYLLLVGWCFLSTFLPFLGPAGIIEFPWFPLNRTHFIITLNNDSLTQQFIFLVNFIGICVIVYSQYYFEKSSYKYWTYLSLFLGSMQGLIISHHAILMFIFWELMGLSSFLLIGYYYEKWESVYGSSKALWINKLGDIGFLIGILGVYIEYDSLDLHSWLEKGTFPEEKSWILFFLILGALAKSAQGPFMIWLPDAMAGPTPASALIHAATMVAAGIYLLFRLHPIFTPDILTILSWTGSLTALLGAIYALFQFRIKAILAGSTLSQLGWMLSALGTSFPMTAIEHLWAHAFFKAGLFLTAGYIIHYQEHHLKPHEDPQNIFLMGNFYSHNFKIYAVLVLLLSSLMGLPLTSGFLTKEAILAAQGYSLTFYVLLFSLIITVFYSLKILTALKKNSEPPKQKFSAWGLTLPIYLLAINSFFFVVSLNPLHLDKPHLPYVKLSITAISLGTILISAIIFLKFQHFILHLTSQTVSNFWGLNPLYNLWIKQNFISKVEIIENHSNLMVNHSLNPLFTISKFLKFLEEKILVETILKLKNLLVGTQWMGITISITHFFQWLDTYLWDFGILNISHSIVNLGKANARLHSSKIQNYLIYSLIIILLGLIFFIN